MKTNKKIKYTAPNLRIDAILIAFICMVAVANCAPIYDNYPPFYDNYPVQPIVNPSK